MYIKYIYIYIYIYKSFITFLYVADMTPVLEVTPMVRSFPHESLTSKRTGGSSFEKCL